MRVLRRQVLWSAAALLTLAQSPGVRAQTITAAKGVFAAGNALPGTTSVTAGAFGMHLVLTGTGFQAAATFPGTQVKWLPSINGGVCPGQTCVFNGTVSANGTQLDVDIPFDLLVSADQGAQVAVANYPFAFPSTGFGFSVVPAGQITGAPNGQVGTAYSAQLVNGGLPPYSLFLEAGSYPPGLSLTSQGVLAGTPTTAGTYTFLPLGNDVWRVSVNSTDVVVTISNPPPVLTNLTFTPTTLPVGEVGAAYNQTLTGSGGTPPYTFKLASGVLPVGMTLSPGGTLVGVPQQAGVFGFGIALSDPRGDSGLLSVQLQIATAVQILTTSLPAAVPLFSYSAQLQAINGLGPYTWSLVSGSLPSGLVLSGATGVISGTAEVGASGTFTLRVVDTLGGTATRTFTIDTVPTNPQITTADPLPTGRVGVAYSATLTATGGSGGYVWQIDTGNLPPGLSLSTAGILSGTPTTQGYYPLTVRVTDSGGRFAAKAFSFTIGPPPITITTTSLPDTPTGTVNLPLAATGGTKPYTWTLVSGSLPAGLTLDSSGVIGGVTDAVGNFSFRVQVREAGGTGAFRDLTLRIVTAPLVITTKSPLPPATVAVAYSTPLAAAGGTKPYQWSATGLPAGLVLTAAGTITGTPTAEGPVRFTVQVRDSAGVSASADLDLDVLPPPLAITTESPLPDATAGVPYSVTFTATGGAKPLNWQIVAGTVPQGLILSSAGTLSGTPGSAGTASFTVLVSDARGTLVTREFTLAVQFRPLTILTSSLPGGTAGQRYSQTASATGGTPPYTWSGTLPAGLAIDPATGVIAGTPTAAGRLSVTLTVTDSAGASASSSFQVDFGLPPTPPLGVGGLPETSDPQKQPAAQFSFGSPFPVRVNGTITLTFRPDTGGDDPAVQFALGGRSASFSIPANATTADTPAVGLQTGTVAGLITLTVRLATVDGADVTPSPAPVRQIRVNAAAPVITSVTATRTASGIDVQIIGYSSTREVTQAVFRFAAAPGATLQTTDVTVAVGPLFAAWYQSAASAQFGSQFRFTQSFAIQGSSQAVASVTVTLANGVGVSPGATGNVQ